MSKSLSNALISQGEENSINPEIIAKSIFSINLNKVNLSIIATESFKKKIYYFYKLNFKNTTKLNKLSFINPETHNIPKKYSYNSAVSSIYLANKLILKKKYDFLVTAPVNKYKISKSTEFTGHTGFLKKLSKAKNTLMLMSTNKIKVAILTEHIPVYKISKSISIDKINKALNLLVEYCKLNNYHNICVLSLNPHAGDNNLLGDEETKIIKKALLKFKKSSIKIYGPISADSAFTPLNRKKYSVFLALYHDQGMIPVKYEGSDYVTNITLGLPYIRTSPGHGTAEDIINKNIASAKSLIKAIKEGISLNQLYGKKIYKN